VAWSEESWGIAAVDDRVELNHPPPIDFTQSYHLLGAAERCSTAEDWTVEVLQPRESIGVVSWNITNTSQLSVLFHASKRMSSEAESLVLVFLCRAIKELPSTTRQIVISPELERRKRLAPQIEERTSPYVTTGSLTPRWSNDKKKEEIFMHITLQAYENDERCKEVADVQLYSANKARHFSGSVKLNGSFQ